VTFHRNGSNKLTGSGSSYNGGFKIEHGTYISVGGLSEVSFDIAYNDKSKPKEHCDGEELSPGFFKGTIELKDPDSLVSSDMLGTYDDYADYRGFVKLHN
jgi:hypothetical protein